MSVKPETTQTAAREMTYATLQQPAAMSESGNTATNWREWKSAFDYYLIATGKETAASREKCALFLHVIGRHGRDILEELDLDEKQKCNYEELVSKFQIHCDPTRNINYERHVFFETYQHDDSFDKFLSALRLRSKSCDFGQLRNSLVLTQIIRGVKDSSMRERMLAKTRLDLEEAVSWCRAVETAGRQAVACSKSGKAAGTEGGAAESTSIALEAVRAGAPRGRARWGGPPRQPQRQQQAHRATGVAASCASCGRKHGGSGQCAARYVKCFRCERVGHYARLCRAKFLAEVQDEDEPEECDEISESLLCNLSVDEVGGRSESWFDDVMVDGVIVNFKLDSGADASVMSWRAFKDAGFTERILKKSKCILREVSKTKLPVIGFFEPILCHNKLTSRQKIYVLNLNCNNLLGIRACRELKLLIRNDKKVREISELKIDESVFEGIGCLPSIYKINVDKTVHPVINASRKVPMKIRPRLQNELNKLERLGIIMKEDAPTDWVSNIVVVERPDKLRICLDPYHLNKAVRRCHFQLPTIDEITSNLSGAKVFSKLDAKNGFWMLRLDEESSKLCTFSTPYGRFRWLRMPFGINCAPEIFQNEMFKIFSMPGVEVFADDLLVWGCDRKQHDERLGEVIRRAVQYGVKFNKQKCVFRAVEVNFLGHKLDGSGISPLGSRVSAIKNITRPSDKKQLERFMGMVNYLARFIPHYSSMATPLRTLLKKDIEFEWLHVHDEAFEQLKSAISAAPVLRYYSPQEAVTVSVDAGPGGLGACLLQAGRPVAYAARTLTPAETRWAQIEKEMLAIYFGCVRFHQYIYGHSEVTVESDHKPLETIFRKALNETPPRLQRMLLKLQDYRLNVVYKPGRFMHIADALSRAAVEPGARSDGCENDVTVHVNAVYENLDATNEKLERIKLETQKDPVLSAVINYYHEGWPTDKNRVISIVRPYWTFRHELHEIKGILFHNNRVVIPSALRKEMLTRIHEGHLGIEKCRARAREAVFWPGMGAQIEECVQRCEPCQRHRAAPPREPLAPHAAPDLPWEHLAADIFELNKLQYLLVVDYYSKFVEVIYLPNMRSDTVISKMKGMFSRFGIPKKLVTDNAKQFVSSEFAEFAKKWEFRHVTSSPLYPRSNGLAERNVQTVKCLLKKASEDKTEWPLALLNFRNTPITGEEHSPAQLLMGRALNTRLPVAAQALRPRALEPRRVHDVRRGNVAKMKQYYDRGTRALPALSRGEEVRVKEGKVWNKARIINKAGGDRSYWIRMDNGGTYRRNRSHIMKSNVKNKMYTRSFSGRYDYMSNDNDNVESRNSAAPVTASPPPAAASPAAARPQLGIVIPTEEELGQSSSSEAIPSVTPRPNRTRSGREVRPPAKFIFE